LKGKCELLIKQVEVVAVNAKIEMDFDQFFNSDGPVRFIDNMAAFLGIDPSKIKIAKIQKGSVIIYFLIISNENADVPSEATDPIIVANEEDSEAATDPNNTTFVTEEVPEEQSQQEEKQNFDALSSIQSKIEDGQSSGQLSESIGYSVSSMISEITMTNPVDLIDDPKVDPVIKPNISNKILIYLFIGVLIMLVLVLSGGACL